LTTVAELEIHEYLLESCHRIQVLPSRRHTNAKIFSPNAAGKPDFAAVRPLRHHHRVNPTPVGAFSNDGHGGFDTG
jgi:hypothetical protein